MSNQAGNPEALIAQLRQELESAHRTNQVLMDRIEKSGTSPASGVLNFKSLALQELVRQRTKALQQMNEGLLQAAAQRKRVDRILSEMQRIASIGGWELDIDTGTIEMTEQILAILGLPPGTDLNTETLCEAFAPDDAKEFARRLDAAWHKRAAFDLELRAAAAGDRMFRVVGHPLVEGDAVVRIYGLIQDITERNRAELALEDSNRRLLKVSLEHQLVLNNISEGIHWIDRNGIIKYENPAAARLLGWEVDDLIGRPAHETIHHSHADGKTYPKNKCHIYDCLSTGTSERVSDEVFWRKDGTCFAVDYSTNPVRDERGEIVGTVVVFSDITARKKAQEDLDRANNQLIEYSRKAGMAEVATGVIHNVGNVLNSVNVSSSIAADHVRKFKAGSLGKVVEMLREHQHDLGHFLSEDARGKLIPEFIGTLSQHLVEQQSDVLKELAHLQKNVEHIKEIVNTQQAYASSAGFIEPQDLSAALDDALRINHESFKRYGVEIVRAYEPLPLVPADRHKVLQILVNITRNARDAMRDSAVKKLTVATRVVDGAAQIVITDTGCGIAPENVTRIFAHGFTTKKDGHGFGLHSAALAAREMKGSLSVQSEGLDKGATFTLALPLAEDESEIPLPS